MRILSGLLTSCVLAIGLAVPGRAAADDFNATRTATVGSLPTSGATAGGAGTKCRDPIDGDGDGEIDWNGGVDGEPADPQCAGRSWHDEKAAPACGVGQELVLLLAALWRWWRRARRMPRDR